MNKDFLSSCLSPDWPAPAGIKCLVTSRATKFETLQNDIGETYPIQWLKQIHGNEVFMLDDCSFESMPEADAIYSRLLNSPCAVRTADCLPVFFCDEAGAEIAVAHAGWRGLAAGVLESTLACFKAKPEQIMAWLGPAIGPCHFEVGAEVKEIFIKAADASIKNEISSAFVPAGKPEKWMADIYQLAKVRLNAAGLKKIYGGGECTFCEKNKFYSYRRNKNTGRMVSLIWKS